MPRSIRATLAASLATSLVVLLAACSGSDSPAGPGTTPPPTAPTTTNPPPTGTASVATVAVTPSAGTLFVGRTTTLSASARDSAGTVLTGRAIAWSSSADDVARVDAAGVVTGVAVGTVTIAATSEGKRAEAALTVQIVPVASVAVSAASGTLRLGDSLTLGAITRDDQQAVLAGRVVRWTSSNPLVATVDSSTGVLTGVDRGAVTVTATSEGIRGTATRVVVIRYRSVSAGAMHACDIASGGIAWRWGLNGQQGRIGLPTMTEHAASSTPVAIAGNLLLTSITAGSEYACAATTSGAGQCWGYSGLGNLGDGGKISFGNTYVTMPQAVVGGLSFRAVSAGFNHTCGVTTTDAVWCWGSNTSGQLGLTLGNGSNVPVRAGGSLLAAEVSAANLATGSASFTCAIADDRLTTFCWGRNDVGQLGNGATSTAAAINAAPSIVQGQKPLPRTR